MATPNNWWNIQNLQDSEKWSSLSLFLKDIYNILNKGFIPSDNMRGSLKEVTFTAADTDTEVEHGLNYSPQYYLVFNRNGGFIVYSGVSVTTNRFIYLRATDTGTARIFIF